MDFVKRLGGVIEDLKNIKQDVPILYYIPEYFIIEELVDPITFNNRGQKAFELLDPKMLWTLDRLRERFGKITINTWKWGGRYQYSGFRPKECEEGSHYSQHRCGRAFDLKFSDYKPEDIRNIIKSNPDDSIFKYITCIEENTPTWLHIDSRQVQKRIKWVDFK